MPANKPRLFLALYARKNQPCSFHYAFFVSEKTGNDAFSPAAFKYHIVDTAKAVHGIPVQQWRYERSRIANVADEQDILILMVIGKVLHHAEMERVLAALPLFQRDDRDQVRARTFDSVVWAQAAVEALRSSSAVSKVPSFEVVQRQALEYFEKKQKEGRFEDDANEEVPVLDILQRRREVVA